MTESSKRIDLPLVRSSERGAFKKCPQAWYWSYVEEIVPVSTVLGAREFGTGIHLAMAEYYVPGKERGRPLLETWNEWCIETEREGKRTEKARKTWDQETFDDMVIMGQFLLKEYMKEYGYDGVADPEWEVICREEPVAANLDNKAINVGTMDLVVRNSIGEVWIVDHKTGKSFPNEWWYRLDDQGGSYAAIGTMVLRQKGLIGPKERVRGIIFNFIRKAKEDDRPKNPAGKYTNKPLKAHYVEQIVEESIYDSPEEKAADFAELKKNTLGELERIAEDMEIVVYGEESKNQPSPVFNRYVIERTPSQQRHQLKRVVEDVTVMSMVRSGEIPVLKSPGNLCPYCDFSQLCELDESQGDTQGMIDVLFKKRDPYHDHRDNASNSKLSVKADSLLKHDKKPSV